LVFHDGDLLRYNISLDKLNILSKIYSEYSPAPVKPFPAISYPLNQKNYYLVFSIVICMQYQLLKNEVGNFYMTVPAVFTFMHFFV
jgi:hypothetical protein